jgi:hypothetical protein
MITNGLESKPEANSKSRALELVRMHGITPDQARRLLKKIGNNGETAGGSKNLKAQRDRRVRPIGGE